MGLIQLWDLIETWGFHVVDLYDLPDCFISPCNKFIKPNITQPLQNGDFWQILVISQFWDLIETWGFRVDDPYDLPACSTLPHNKFTKPTLMQPLQW